MSLSAMAMVVVVDEVKEEEEADVKEKVMSEKEYKRKYLKGRPKSGRAWKRGVKYQRASAKTDVKAFKTTWEHKMKERERKNKLRDQIKAFKEKQSEDKARKKEQNIIRKRKRLENERKGEVVQVITDTRKLKKLKRGQWKLIEKR
eukprot:TRINITY_DN486_c0_g1_i1.p1 TRINITY_DN486_c0_g1~~TRINITY_DN486_c0_g1_i1.p1  ORF type:complete len:146 (+),score=37.82 TRINITY_DN486_c0_g1_i1:82-519(+)